MRILLAVIDDLFQFARTALFGLLIEHQTQNRVSSFVLPEATPQLLLPSFEHNPHVSTKRISSETPVSPISGPSYFVGETRTFLYCEPVIAFDTAVKQLPYGALVRVQKLGGRWAEVRIDDVEGWILKDALREQISDVLPTFYTGELYDAENSETIKLRISIDDSFAGAAALLPLLDAEYVTYKLQQRNILIPWTQERPRLPGTWQRKLRGKVGIHISITPFVGTVMEYVTDEKGHLCFVEAVFPDESIKVTSVGIFAEGVFTELTMAKDEWKELRPVFIEVT